MHRKWNHLVHDDHGMTFVNYKHGDCGESNQIWRL